MTRWTMRQALFCLIGSTAFTLSVSVGGYTLWMKSRKEKLRNAKYQITAIVQTGPEKEALKTAYLAELLGLSADQPTQLYALNLKKAEEKLLASPLIAQAHLKRLPPATLYIDYTVRRPLAWLADYKNTAIDHEGHLFPVAPFLSPKHLPELYLGITSFSGWRLSLKDPSLQLALELLQYLDAAPWTEGLRVKRVDVSNAFAPSLGQREIVLFTEEELLLPQGGVYVFPKILRLAPKNYVQQLGNFFSLRRAMMDDYRRQLAGGKQEGGRFAPRVIDLRIPQLAFVEKG
jgi:hypothetical protein